jgi:hypothetical protein
MYGLHQYASVYPLLVSSEAMLNETRAFTPCAEYEKVACTETQESAEID